MEAARSSSYKDPFSIALMKCGLQCQASKENKLLLVWSAAKSDYDVGNPLKMKDAKVFKQIKLHANDIKGFNQEAIDKVASSIDELVQNQTEPSNPLTRFFERLKNLITNQEFATTKELGLAAYGSLRKADLKNIRDYFSNVAKIPTVSPRVLYGSQEPPPLLQPPAIIRQLSLLSEDELKKGAADGKLFNLENLLEINLKDDFYSLLFNHLDDNQKIAFLEGLCERPDSLLMLTKTFNSKKVFDSHPNEQAQTAFLESLKKLPLNSKKQLTATLMNTYINSLSKNSKVETKANVELKILRKAPEIIKQYLAECVVLSSISEPNEINFQRVDQLEKSLIPKGGLGLTSIIKDLQNYSLSPLMLTTADLSQIELENNP